MCLDAILSEGDDRVAEIASRLAAVTGAMLLVSPIALTTAASQAEPVTVSEPAAPVTDAVLLANDGVLPVHDDVAVITASVPELPALDPVSEEAEEEEQQTLASLIHAESVTELGAAAPATVTGADAIPAELLGDGLRVEYFTTTDLTQPAALEQVQASSATRLPSGAVAVRMTGAITAPEDGSYELVLTATGGARMLVDGDEVAHLEQPEPPAEGAAPTDVPRASVVLELTAGEELPVQVEMTDEVSPEPVLSVGWHAPDGVVSAATEAAAKAAADATTVVVYVPSLPARTTDAEEQGEIAGALPQDLGDLLALVATTAPRVVVVEDTAADDDLAGWDAAGILHVPTGSIDLDTLARLLTGAAQPTGTLATPLPLPHGPPAEDQDTQPLYPEGHGLRYWSYDVLALTAGDGSADVTVASTGTAAGSTPIYIAASAADSDQQHPAGTATIDLDAGDTASVTIPLDLTELDLDSPDTWPITLHAGTAPDSLTATAQLLASDAQQGTTERSATRKQQKQGGIVMPAVPGLTLTTGNGAVTLENAVTVDGILRLSGTLPEVSVADARSGARSGWTVSARASDLTGPGGTLPARNLGWVPTVLTPTDGAVAGPAVAGSLSGGRGLGEAAVLGRATRAGGTVTFGADFLLETPASTMPGNYTGTLTVTLFPLEKGPQP